MCSIPYTYLNKNYSECMFFSCICSDATSNRKKSVQWIMHIHMNQHLLIWAKGTVFVLYELYIVW